MFVPNQSATFGENQTQLSAWWWRAHDLGLFWRHSKNQHNDDTCPFLPSQTAVIRGRHMRRPQWGLLILSSYCSRLWCWLWCSSINAVCFCRGSERRINQPLTDATEGNHRGLDRWRQPLCKWSQTLTEAAQEALDGDDKRATSQSEKWQKVKKERGQRSSVILEISIKEFQW